jgi:protein-disulfide isomerase
MKRLGLTPGREENISDVLKQLNDIENSSKQMLDIISKENYVSVKIEEPNNAEFKGNENANIVIIEFADFQCPYCLQFFKETEKPLEQAYINNGIAKFYYMHMPLVDIHNQALPAALASECAREQGKFWDYHDALFNNQQVLSNQTYENIAKELNLNIEQWNSCYEQRKYLSVINSHAMFAQGLRISGTPAFLIFKKTGLTAQQKAQLINYNKAFYNANGRPLFILVTDNQNTGILISGALPFGVFQQVIDMIR